MRTCWIVPLLVAAMALGACSATQQTAPVTAAVTVQDHGPTRPTTDASRKAMRSANALLVYHLRNVAGTPVAKEDKAFLRQAELSANTAGDGDIIRWHNPASATFGEVIVSDAAQAGGKYCRAYQTSITIDGRTYSAVGSACADGRSQKVGAALGPILG